MGKQYPAIGVKRKAKPNIRGGLPCIICSELTTGKVDIELSWFRGEDDQVRVCNDDQNKDAEILSAYIAKD